MPQLEIKTNAEHLEQVLLHLLKNAALYTSSGNIRLEFKRKGAHVCQFIITDNGTGIPDDLKENLFKPFNEAKDLAQGDGLGLPICALMASKLNGTLSIDKEYKKDAGSSWYCRYKIDSPCLSFTRDADAVTLQSGLQ